jgi:hypothetical protein
MYPKTNQGNLHAARKGLGDGITTAVIAFSLSFLENPVFCATAFTSSTFVIL